jgi:hypothetical protein
VPAPPGGGELSSIASGGVPAEYVERAGQLLYETFGNSAIEITPEVVNQVGGYLASGGTAAGAIQFVETFIGWNTKSIDDATELGEDWGDNGLTGRYDNTAENTPDPSNTLTDPYANPGGPGPLDNTVSDRTDDTGDIDSGDLSELGDAGAGPSSAGPSLDPWGDPGGGGLAPLEPQLDAVGGAPNLDIAVNAPPDVRTPILELPDSGEGEGGGLEPFSPSLIGAESSETGSPFSPELAGLEADPCGKKKKPKKKKKPRVECWKGEYIEYSTSLRKERRVKIPCDAAPPRAKKAKPKKSAGTKRNPGNGAMSDILTN